MHRREDTSGLKCVLDNWKEGRTLYCPVTMFQDSFVLEVS